MKQFDSTNRGERGGGGGGQVFVLKHLNIEQGHLLGGKCTRG